MKPGKKFGRRFQSNMTKLKSMLVDEISFVDMPANKRQFLYKRQSEEDNVGDDNKDKDENEEIKQRLAKVEAGQESLAKKLDAALALLQSAHDEDADEGDDKDDAGTDDKKPTEEERQAIAVVNEVLTDPAATPEMVEQAEEILQSLGN